jgi:hypothetical protein
MNLNANHKFNKSPKEIICNFYLQALLLFSRLTVHAYFARITHLKIHHFNEICEEIDCYSSFFKNFQILTQLTRLNTMKIWV